MADVADWRLKTLLMIRCCPAALTAYAEAPTSTNCERLNVAPPSKWLTRPSEVNGRTKNEVSETVFANPMLANGVTDEKLRLKLLVQSMVARPVPNPFSLSPVGAVASTLDAKFTASPSTPR